MCFRFPRIDRWLGATANKSCKEGWWWCRARWEADCLADDLINDLQAFFPWCHSRPRPVIQKSIFTPEFCDCQANFPSQDFKFPCNWRTFDSIHWFNIFCQAHNKIINHFLKRQNRSKSRTKPAAPICESMFRQCTRGFWFDHCRFSLRLRFFSGSLRETFNFVYLRRQLSRSRSQKWKKSNAGRGRRASAQPVPS